MNNSNSDWLNDTVPNSENNNVSNDTTETSENNNIVDLKKSESESENEKQMQTLSNKSLGDLANKIDEEEISEEEKYLNEFIGPNAEKFMYKIISFPAFIFTFLYMFYRKMYILGLITLVLQFLILFFVNPYLSLIINILSCLFFNSLYINHCKNKIEKIKHRSGSKESGYVLNICGEKGGVNKLIALFAFVIEVLLVLFFIIFLPVTKHFDGAKSLINEYASEIGIDFDSFSN